MGRQRHGRVGTAPAAAALRTVRGITDDKSGEPLCTYELEGKPTGSSTAVLMCKVWRERPGAIWHVTAIGSLGEGRASNYEPIHASIRAYEAAENNLLEKSD